MADDTEDKEVPSILLPCISCNRTFRPEALAKHTKVCEKSLMKKRKKFDSSKQRIQGTDLAEFLPILPTFTKKSDKSPVRKPQSKWREKHNEQTVHATRLPPGQATTPGKPSDQEHCPYCERSFGPKAYDRHLEWCRERQTRVQPISPASQRAKERLEARTKYRAPITSKRSASKDTWTSSKRDPSPHHHSHPIPLTPTMARRNLNSSVVADNAQNTQTKNQPFIKGSPLRSSSTRRNLSDKRTEQPPSASEVYDPYKSAEKQMQQLFESDNDLPKLTSIIKTPVVLSSQTSAFTKFSPIVSPQPLFISEDDNKSNPSIKSDSKSDNSSEKSVSSLTINSQDNLSSKDFNQNPISLSTLSLCSTISIESLDRNKNGYRLGYSSSAKTVEKKTPVPIRRTVSAVESRRARDSQKGKLKMEDMLFGCTTTDDRYFGSPVVTDQLDKSFDHSSSGSLFKPVYDDEVLNAEQELIKSVCEFEKLLSSSSSSCPSPSPSSPSSKLFPSLISSFQPRSEEKQKFQQDEEDLHGDSHPGGLDSAYSSLNRKSPVGGEGEHVKELPFTSEMSRLAKFCHECGSKYPFPAAKFCCECGLRRVII